MLCMCSVYVFLYLLCICFCIRFVYVFCVVSAYRFLYMFCMCSVYMFRILVFIYESFYFVSAEENTKDTSGVIKQPPGAGSAQNPHDFTWV